MTFSPLRRKTPEVATRVPLSHRHGDMQQFVQDAIEEDQRCAHLEETQSLRHLLVDSSHQLLQAGTQRAAVCVEVGREAQTKCFVKRSERLFLICLVGPVERTTKHVRRSAFRNPDEVDSLEFEGLGDKIHVVWNPVLFTTEVIAFLVGRPQLCGRQLPCFEILQAETGTNS